MAQIEVNLTQAYNIFVSALKMQNTDPNVLQTCNQQQLAKLDQYMDVLLKQAEAGMEDQLASLLSVLLQEWAYKEAVELLLRSPAAPYKPNDPGLPRAFWQKLHRQHVALSSEVLLHMKQGEIARARQEVERAQNWQAVAHKALEDQRQQSVQVQNTNVQFMQDQQRVNQQWLRQEQDRYLSYQQANREWAHTALSGVQQAQQGVKQWFDFASTTQNTVATMMAGVEQRQAAVVEQTMQKASTRKWMNCLLIMGLLILGVIALYGCAFFALMHLY